MWSVYILQCVDNSLYTGIALDVKRRIKEHTDGKGSRYVRSKLPVKLLYHEPCRGKSRALKREAEIKRLSRSKKLALMGIFCSEMGQRELVIFRFDLPLDFFKIRSCVVIFVGAAF